MSTEVLFTSDLHLGHVRASVERGYASVVDHDLAVIERLRQQSTKRTVLYILGDVAMKLDSFLMLYNVPGRKRLVRGNHDVLTENHYRNMFERIYGAASYKNFWLTHIPIHPQELFRRRLNVHGHIHKNTASPELPYPYFNVNWDFWGRAINLDEIKEFASVNEIRQGRTYGGNLPSV